MIELRNVTKSFRINGHTRTIVSNANIVFPTGHTVALLGRNGAGKSTLLQIIAGTTDLDEGDVIQKGTISWPIGFRGSFHPELTGAQNAKFIARIYGYDTTEVLEFSRDFAELGSYFDLPFKTYSSGMRSRLAFGVSMAVPFDTYLIDEVTSVGDASFREKCSAVLTERMKDASGIFVSHSMPQVKEMCDIGVILEKGQLSYYDDIDEAIAQHNANMRGHNG